jgi:hypothetical protein
LIFTDEPGHQASGHRNLEYPGAPPSHWGEWGATPCSPHVARGPPPEKGYMPGGMSDEEDAEWDCMDNESDDDLQEDQIIDDWYYEHVMGVK